MKTKYKIILGIFIFMICIFGIIKFYKPNEVKAAYTHNFEKLDEYVDDDGKTVMRYNLYVEVSQNSSFNHVESNFDIIGLELLGIEPQNGFVLEELELDSALTGHFSLTSNEVYQYNDKTKVIYGIISFKTTGVSDCKFTLKPMMPTTVTTNTISLKKEAYNDANATTVINEVNLEDEFYYKITIENISQIKTDNIKVVDEIPNELEILDASNGKVEGNTISWDLDGLDKNATKDIFIKVKVKENLDIDINIIKNTVKVIIGDNEFEKTDTINLLKPDLEVTKTTNKNQVKPNEEFKYTITIKNNGKGIAKNVVVEDEINENLTILSTSVPSSGVSNNLVFYLGDMSPSDTKKIIIIVKGNEDSELTTINNIVRVTADNNDLVESSVSIKVVDSDLKITKSANKTEVRPNEEFEYTINIENLGEANSNSLTIEDLINSNLEIISASNNGEINGQTITWNLTTLEAKQTKTLTIKVKVKEGVLSNTSIENVVTLNEVGKAPINSSVDVLVLDSQITVEKTVSKTELRPNDTFTYYITISNIGDTYSNDIIITDVIDANLEIISAENATINGQTITWHEVSLEKSESKQYEIDVKVLDSVPNNTKINNLVTAKESNKPEETDEVEVIIKKPILNITKEASNEHRSKKPLDVTPGEEFYYVITVTNTGEVPSDRIIVEDNINENLYITRAKGAELDGNKITWKIDSLLPGNSTTLVIYVKMTSDIEIGTCINNTAVLKHNNEIKEASDNVCVVDSDIKFEKLSSKNEVKLNDEFYYTLRISNTGDYDENNLTITDELPKELELIKVEYDDQKINYNNNNNILKFNIDNINKDETIEILVYVKLINNQNDVVKNISFLSYANKNLESEITIDILKSKIVVNKTSDKDKVLNDKHFYYTITVTNIGNYDSNQLQIIDEYDKNLIIVECGDCKINENSIEWTVDTLKENESKKFVVEVYVTNQKDGTVIDNKVIVKEKEKPDIEDTKEVTVIEPTVEIVKYVDKSVVKLGEDFKYYIKVRNDSDVAIENILITDNIDDSLKIIDAGNATVKENIVTIYTSLLKNEEITFEITVKPTLVKEIKNIATISYNGRITPSNEVLINVEESNIENPNTGNSINIIILVIGVSTFVLINYYIKNRKKIYKI